MGCLKDEPRRKPKSGWFRCSDCGAVAKKKKNLCEPKKIKDKVGSQQGKTE